MTRLLNTEHRLFARFLYLAGIELILAGAWTLVIALSQNLRTTTLLAVAVMMVGVVCFAAPTFLKKQATSIVSVLGSGVGQVAALAIPVLLSAFLFLRTPSVDALRIIGAVMLCVWLIGIEALFFFQKTKEANPEKISSNRLAFLALALAYGILLIPSRVPSLLDGFPWNTPLEFITATLILPIAFFFGRSFFSKKAVTLLLALLLVAKLTLSFFLPQSGLGVHAYSNEEARVSGKWDRTYASFQNPHYSQIMQLPYRSFYDLPVEYINSHGYNKRDFRLSIEFNAAISLNEDERLVILVQGTDDRQIELVDLENGEITIAVTAKSAEDLSHTLFNEIPYIHNAELKGSLLFSSYGNARFEPVILHKDGSTDSALPRMWLSSSSLEFPVAGYQFIQNLIALLLLGIVLLGFSLGALALYRNHTIDILDIYLALTGVPLFFVMDTVSKSDANLFLLGCVIALTVIKWLDFKHRSRAYSAAGYLFSIGIPVLLAFLPLDLSTIQSVLQIPQYQDAMEYQWLARNIYVGQDAFLQQTPPWSYKVLYPYIVGFMHILFGHSMSAQLFLNIWCALLSVIVMVETALFFGSSKRLAFLTSSAFLLLLLLPISFTYYFRFGLIEPMAILTLLATGYFAINGRLASLFASGILTGMLRLNFGGAIFTAITFMSPSGFTGGFSQAWGNLIRWCMANWLRLAFYLAAIPAPALLITFLYSRFIPTYTLSPDLNKQGSIASILESLMIVIVGGDVEYLTTKFMDDPIGGLLITLPIITGMLIALTSLVYRKGIFSQIDLRLSLLLISNLPVYAVLKPIAYFPRYSWSFLPPALILLGLVLQFTLLRDNKVFQDNE